MKNHFRFASASGVSDGAPFFAPVDLRDVAFPAEAFFPPVRREGLSAVARAPEDRRDAPEERDCPPRERPFDTGPTGIATDAAFAGVASGVSEAR